MYRMGKKNIKKYLNVNPISVYRRGGGAVSIMRRAVFFSLSDFFSRPSARKKKKAEKENGSATFLLFRTDTQSAKHIHKRLDKTRPCHGFFILFSF